MSEMNDTLRGVNNSLDIAEQKISELKGTAIENIQNKTHTEKRLKINEQSIRELKGN